MAADNLLATMTKEAVYIDPSMIIEPKDYSSAPPAVELIDIPIDPEKKELILNIETTGLYPWDSRIISIGWLDPRDPNNTTEIVMLSDEEAMIKTFLKFYHENGYNQIIGYNLVFDFRFICARAMYWRLPIAEFLKVDLYDMMQVMQQMRQSFVYGISKAGTLDQWAEELFNFPKIFTDEEMLTYYAKGEYAKVFSFALDQVLRTYTLYILWKNSELRSIGEIGYIVPFTEPEFFNVDKSGGSITLDLPEEDLNPTQKAICSKCLAEGDIPIGSETAICKICGNILTL